MHKVKVGLVSFSVSALRQTYLQGTRYVSILGTTFVGLFFLPRFFHASNIALIIAYI